MHRVRLDQSAVKNHNLACALNRLVAVAHYVHVPVAVCDALVIAVDVMLAPLDAAAMTYVVVMLYVAMVMANIHVGVAAFDSGLVEIAVKEWPLAGVDYLVCVCVFVDFEIHVLVAQFDVDPLVVVQFVVVKYVVLVGTAQFEHV